MISSQEQFEHRMEHLTQEFPDIVRSLDQVGLSWLCLECPLDVWDDRQQSVHRQVRQNTDWICNWLNRLLDTLIAKEEWR